LNIAPHTVHKHSSAILAALYVVDREQALAVQRDDDLVIFAMVLAFSAANKK
jgi:DNA-binding NarL/FixJ family response regulator